MIRIGDKEGCSFLKKRTKKLLRFCDLIIGIAATAAMVLLLTCIWQFQVNAQGSEPLSRMEFRVARQDRDVLMRILVQYSREQGFTLQDVGAVMPHHYIEQPFFANLWRSDDVQIVVTDIEQPTNILIIVTANKHEAEATQKSAILFDEIRKQWPDLHRYERS